MPEQLFLRTTITVIWDFDGTLVPGYMQGPLFQHFHVDESQFWNEVNALPQFYRAQGITRVSRDTVYLNHILSYVRAGRFPGLNNTLLRQLGSKIELHAGLPEFFQKVKDHVAARPNFSQYQITVEHYVVSTGLRELIMGSKIGPYLDGVWACELAEASAPPDFLLESGKLFEQSKVAVCEIVYALDNTSKTRAIFEINKGTNKVPQIDVNATIAQEIRRVPFQNMIYVADGPSDVPCFSLVNQYGGRTYAVYKPQSDKEFRKAYDLQKQRRVEAFGEADYRDGSQTAMWIMSAVEDIANRIVRDRTRVLVDEVEQPVGHVMEPSKSADNTPPLPEVSGELPRKGPLSVKLDTVKQASDKK